MPNAKKRIIYSLRLYLKLKELGFEPIGTSKNPNKPQFICWIFQKTPQFEAAVDAIMEGHL